MILLTGLIFGLHMSSYLKIMGTLEPLNDLVATEVSARQQP